MVRSRNSVHGIAVNLNAHEPGIERVEFCVVDDASGHIPDNLDPCLRHASRYLKHRRLSHAGQVRLEVPRAPGGAGTRQGHNPGHRHGVGRLLRPCVQSTLESAIDDQVLRRWRRTLGRRRRVAVQRRRWCWRGCRSRRAGWPTGACRQVTRRRGAAGGRCTGRVVGRRGAPCRDGAAEGRGHRPGGGGGYLAGKEGTVAA